MTQRTRSEHGPVMVGVDGSPGSWAAVGVGAWEAKRRRTQLLLVHGYTEPMPYPGYGFAPASPLDHAVRDAAKAMLTDVELRTRADHPGLSVRATLVSGGGASALVELSRTASLVVVGSRGHGGFAGLSIGSVGVQLAAHAHAPVIVVRPEAQWPSEGVEAVAGVSRYTPSGRGVLVGVDGSPQSTAAVSFALEEASARDVGVLALYAWWGLSESGQVARGQEEADRMLAEAMAGWTDKFPDVPVRRLAKHDPNPSAMLVEESRGADLVVVGSRGRGGFSSLLLGSVSRTVVSHAHCPVAVIRDQT